MTSYKTLLFGTIAFVCAASPALADSASAVPKASRMDSASAVPGPSRMDSASAVPGPSRKDSASAVPGPSRKDSASAVPKFLVLSGLAGGPTMRIDLSWLQAIIGR
ncbi:MAG TPA: hypothetical protein VFE17_10255 [Candidatus Baltobacteraceae bacterium]|nr:hypothetical protein [Candidatus Baltobacteraceae bacterium]